MIMGEIWELGNIFLISILKFLNWDTKIILTIC